MHLRWWKIGLLAGPLLLLAGLIVAITLAWAMRGQFTNGVFFDKSIGAMSIRDQQAIRHIVLIEPLITHPTHALVRYRVVLNKRTQKDGQTFLSGTVEPNRDVDAHGVIVVTNKDGDWKVSSLIATSF